MLEASTKNHFIIGAKQVKNAINGKKAAKVFVASDSDSCIIEPVVELAHKHNVSVIYIDTRKELGEMCGIDVKAACAVETI